MSMSETVTALADPAEQSHQRGDDADREQEAADQREHDADDVVGV